MILPSCLDREAMRSEAAVSSSQASRDLTTARFSFPFGSKVAVRSSSAASKRDVQLDPEDILAAHRTGLCYLQPSEPAVTTGRPAPAMGRHAPI